MGEDEMKKRMYSKIGLAMLVMAVGCMAVFSTDAAADPTGIESPQAESMVPEVPKTEGTPVAFDAPPPVGTKAHCPVMGNDFTVSEGTARSEHKGKHYVFCCPGCKPGFDADPEKYLKSEN